MAGNWHILWPSFLRDKWLLWRAVFFPCCPNVFSSCVYDHLGPTNPLEVWAPMYPSSTVNMSFVNRSLFLSPLYPLMAVFFIEKIPSYWLNFFARASRKSALIEQYIWSPFPRIRKTNPRQIILLVNRLSLKGYKQCKKFHTSRLVFRKIHFSQKMSLK